MCIDGWLTSGKPEVALNRRKTYYDGAKSHPKIFSSNVILRRPQPVMQRTTSTSPVLFSSSPPCDPHEPLNLNDEMTEIASDIGGNDEDDHVVETHENDWTKNADALVRQLLKKKNTRLKLGMYLYKRDGLPRCGKDGTLGGRTSASIAPSLAVKHASTSLLGTFERLYLILFYF